MYTGVKCSNRFAKNPKRFNTNTTIYSSGMIPVPQMLVASLRRDTEMYYQIEITDKTR